MSLIDDIKAESEGKLNGQTEQERDFEKCLNRIFYLGKNIEKETEFINMVMTRGQETAERKGLHCSNIISAYSPFCLRGQVLSLFYRQKQNKGISVPLMRIFAAGDAIHEKWQRLFIRAGYAEPHMCDRTMFDDRYDLSYTPDIICKVHNTMYVGELKSVNTNQFKRLVAEGEDHTAGMVQCFMYMYLTGIHDGFVLCEDKNTQEFYVRLYTFDQTVIQTYIDRLDAIQEAKKHLVKDGKIPKRIEVCECYGCKCANDCVMAEVCYGKQKERI